MSNEELLKKHENCYVFGSYLHDYKDVYELYKKQQSCFWTPPEIDFSGDRAVYLKMGENERHFFKMVLSFFAAADGIVNENISNNFMEDIDIPVIKACYGWQQAMEDIHNETYTLLLDSMIPDKEEKEKLFEAVKHIPVIKKKYDYAHKWITCGCPFKYRLIGFLIFEGVFFSGSFCSIFWNKSKGGAKTLNGLVTANEFIARDEGLHCEFAVLLYSKLQNRLTEKEIHNMFKNAVDIEKEFIIESLPCAMIGMNATLMSEYIEYIADFWLVRLGYNKLYNTPNPFTFMEAISLESKTNFFEQRVTQYSKAETDHKFTIEDDF